MSTPVPRGIERDDTEHGKLYYTRAQLLAYGNQCTADALKATKEPDTQSAQDGKYSAAVESLMRGFGIKK